MRSKRADYINWDEYFMGVAHLSGMRSKDPNTQVGACIVSQNNKILSMGYNGFPAGCSDDEFPWGREGEELDTKYPYVTHSELNAILNYREVLWKGPSCMYPCFPVMNVRRPLYKQVFEKWCMIVISIMVLLPMWQVRRCLMRPV